MPAGVMLKGLSGKIAKEMGWDEKDVNRIAATLLMTGYCQALADAYKRDVMTLEDVKNTLLKSQWAEYVGVLPQMFGKFCEMSDEEADNMAEELKRRYADAMLDEAKRMLETKDN